MLNSIRIRLTILYLGVLAFVIIAFAALTYFLLVRVLAQETDDNLVEMARSFGAGVHSEQSDEEEPKNAKSEITEAVGDFRFRDYGIVVFSESGQPIASTLPDASFEQSLLNLITERKLESPFANLTTANVTFRVYRFSLDFRTNHYQIFVVRSLEDQNDIARRLIYIFLFAVPLALVLTGFGGYFLAGKSLAPVVDMSRQVATIGATNLHERLPVKNEKDELGNLAQIINALLLRLENSFENQRRFMADASHELRTPLAIVRGESEVALSKENRPPAQLRESLSIVHDESKRLTKIVEDLFTLARADSGQFKANLTEIYLDELLADCLRKVRVLAEKRHISLNFSTLEEMPMRGDESLLRRLFMNLLDNAIKYNRDGGQICVSGKKTADSYRITIADTGAGVSKEERAKIFERFYRADKARSRRQETVTGGAGLGLSIAQWIAELHRGKIELVSSSTAGSAFAVVFPRK